MASPVVEGTLGAAPFINKYVDILHEDIFIHPTEDFSSAKFNIEYFVYAHKSGNQIPLLFIASEYKDKFKIWVDDKEVQLQNIPEKYTSLYNSPFKDFDQSFDTTGYTKEPLVTLRLNDRSGITYPLSDLKYFETDLLNGNHKIRVEYNADLWIDLSGWVKEYQFKYALSPAKYWKSFGTLSITLDASELNKKITSNLGTPTKGSLDSVCTWNFNKLPVEVMEISYKPEVSEFANFLIEIGPTGVSLSLGIFIIIFHCWLIMLNRKKGSIKRFPIIRILGCFFVPLLILILFISSYSWIDAAIGDQAGRRHGYIFLVIFLYPFLLLIYFILAWLLDSYWKKKFIHS